LRVIEPKARLVLAVKAAESCASVRPSGWAKSVAVAMNPLPFRSELAWAAVLPVKA
jgi:hypothetical protein